MAERITSDSHPFILINSQVAAFLLTLHVTLVLLSLSTGHHPWKMRGRGFKFVRDNNCFKVYHEFYLYYVKNHFKELQLHFQGSNLKQNLKSPLGD